MNLTRNRTSNEFGLIVSTLSSAVIACWRPRHNIGVSMIRFEPTDQDIGEQAGRGTFIAVLETEY
jgi:hypothetical protein